LGETRRGLGGRKAFLYVVNGGKTRNPAAAMALIERVR
jgi:hypothetical protein